MNFSQTLKENPFHLFLFSTIIVLLAFALAPLPKMDFQDMQMFGQPLETMIRVLPFFLFILWLLYLGSGQLLYSSGFTKFHVLTTTIIFWLILVILYLGIYPTSFISDMHESIGLLLQILTWLLIFIQLIYPVNLGLGLLYKRRLK